MRKVYTRGIANANKVMLMAGVAYNLKKYLKFTSNRVETVSMGMALLFLFDQIWLEILGSKPRKISVPS